MSFREIFGRHLLKGVMLKTRIKRDVVIWFVSFFFGSPLCIILTISGSVVAHARSIASQVSNLCLPPINY